jgi:acetyl esterase/lipase
MSHQVLRFEHPASLTRRRFFALGAVGIGTAALALLCCVTNSHAAETKPIAPAAAKAAPAQRAIDLYVNPQTGSDTANGRSAEIKAGNGPFKTIAHAIATANASDTIHLAPLIYTNESVEFRNKSGEPDKPITLDGHGAIIDGSDPLIERDWHEVDPGLYRNTALYAKPLLASEAFVSRFALAMNGKLNRMGHSAKGRSDPYKAVADLKFGEWTYQEKDEHAYFLRIDPTKTLANYNIRVPTRVSAVQIYGNVSHLVIKNITATHVINDGFALTTGSAPNEINYKVRDIVYENIKAIECCDDGMSSHADCELSVDGLEVDGCATGIANCGGDTIDHLVTRNIHGVDVYYYGGRHVLKNSRLQVHGNVAALSLTTQYGNAKWLADPSRGALYDGWDRCVLQMENVVFDVSQTPADSSKALLIADRCTLESNKTTMNGLTPVVAKGGSLKSTAAATTTTPARPRPTLANVPYGSHERQVLDFYKAESAQPTPLLIFIHGGGWVAGDKSSLGGMTKCLAAGISIISINYRYTWQAQLAGVKPPVEWPLHDAARALQFVRSKAAEWNIDKQRIATSGGSAGGCSSLWLALHDDLADPKSSDPIARESTRLWCAAATGAQTSLDPRQLQEWTPNSCYGGHAFGFMNPTKLSSRDTHFAEFLAARDQLLPWIKEYSPIELVTADDPPIYLLYNEPPALGQNEKDPTHTANYGVKLQEKLRSVGVECELVYPAVSAEVHEWTANYLIKKLKAPAK